MHTVPVWLCHNRQRCRAGEGFKTTTRYARSHRHWKISKSYKMRYTYGFFHSSYLILALDLELHLPRRGPLAARRVWHSIAPLFTPKSSPRQLETFPYHQLASKASLIIATMASKFMVHAAFEARLLLRPSHQRIVLFGTVNKLGRPTLPPILSSRSYSDSTSTPPFAKFSGSIEGSQSSGPEDKNWFFPKAWDKVRGWGKGKVLSVGLALDATLNAFLVWYVQAPFYMPVETC
jgi:hypothetical protein